MKKEKYYIIYRKNWCNTFWILKYCTENEANTKKVKENMEGKYKNIRFDVVPKSVFSYV